MSTTPYMSLLLPDVSTTLGPEWATELNDAFTTVDEHDHTSGKGVLVPTAGLNINADLSFNGYNSTSLRSVRLATNAAPLALVTDLGCLYRSGVDLWFNDGSGNQIQLTASGALNAASIGGIGGDYSTSTASVAYSDSTKTFTFLQDTNKYALMAMGTILLGRTDNTSSAVITIKASTSLVSGWTLTLPIAPPASTMFVAIDSSGNLSFTNTLTALTLTGDLTVGGTADFNGTVNLGTAVNYELAPISFYRPPTVSMVWASATEITVQAGRYFLNNKVYTNGSPITWTWAASGQNAGLDTGVEANSTWYYLYGVLVTGAFGVVASTTAPTSPYDTNLSGTDYDTNVYLGAFYNNSSGNIMQFVQNGNRFDCMDRLGIVSHTGNTTLTSKTIISPATATHVYGQLKLEGPTISQLGQVNGNNAANDELGISLSVTNQAMFGHVLVPLVAATTVYLKTEASGNTINFAVLGWLDKWL